MGRGRRPVPSLECDGRGALCASGRFAGAAAEITAQQLKVGADHFEGQFGDGKGKWRLFIEADQDIQAMSLLESPTGHIANLSSGTAVY